MNTPPKLTVIDLSVIYRNGHQALEEISFELSGGCVCALIGVNGSGKSTLFNSMMGIIKPQNGCVRINELSVHRAIAKKLLAYVPQMEQIDWHFPILVRDVVMQGRFGHMGFFRRPRSIDRKIVADALEKLAINDLSDRQIGELSGGQKKRVFLARALAQQSPIILLDEPFTGVDVTTETAIMQLLRQLRANGHLIIVSTHNLGSVPDYCDQVLMINRRLIVAGETKLYFTQEYLAQTFGGILKNVHLSQPSGLPVTIISDDERAAIFYGKRAIIQTQEQAK